MSQWCWYKNLFLNFPWSNIWELQEHQFYEIFIQFLNNIIPSYVNNPRFSVTD